MRKVRLTKKRLAALDLAITLDDILYEKFKRLNERLNRDADRLIRNRKKVFRVIARHKNYDEVLMIEDVQMTEEGSQIIVRVVEPLEEVL